MRVASLFAGIGGIDLAFAEAGHDIVWANEKNKYAIQTYRKNFQETIVDDRDIRYILSEDIPDTDILIAGFPCQSFSVMGYQKGFKDPRGNLFFEIARIADEKKPQIVFLENVRNLLRHDNGKTFKVVLETLSELGYYVKYKVMSPHEYANIPQIRERIFIIAFKDFTMYNAFEFPTSIPLTKKINDIIDRSEHHHEVYYYTEKSKYYSLLNERMTDDEVIYRIDDWGVAHEKWDICPTLKANMGTFPDRVPIIRDDFGIRKLTPYECLRFQGFPESFKFPNVPLNEAYKQCGNTVCMYMIRNICVGV